jgi:hypothetical protein
LFTQKVRAPTDELLGSSGHHEAVNWTFVDLEQALPLP